LIGQPFNPVKGGTLIGLTMNRVKGYHFDWSANESSNNVAL